jgi:hypothetical protein
MDHPYFKPVKEYHAKNKQWRMRKLWRCVAK